YSSGPARIANDASVVMLSRMHDSSSATAGIWTMSIAFSFEHSERAIAAVQSSATIETMDLSPTKDSTTTSASHPLPARLRRSSECLLAESPQERLCLRLDLKESPALIPNPLGLVPGPRILHWAHRTTGDLRWHPPGPQGNHEMKVSRPKTWGRRPPIV